MNEVIRKHLNSPAYRRVLPDPDGEGAAGDESCGARITFSLRFSGGGIEAAAFDAAGSAAAVAAGDILAGMVTGAGWREAASLSVAALAAAMGLSDAGGSGGRAGPVNRTIVKAAEAAVDSLHASMESAMSRGRFPRADRIDPGTVLVAMSGGVDSSTACLLERERGRDVIGITMRLWSGHVAPESPSARSGCCSGSAILEARRTCHQLGLPHLTIDCRRDFDAVVIDDFFSGYMKGWTPNPCARCNGAFRFPLLQRLADHLGAGIIATGHYARITAAACGRPALARGADPAKDQSYALWGIDPGLLGRLDFPLGRIKKSETRELAAAARLPASDRPESQDICFIPGGDYRDFIRKRLRAAGIPEPGRGDIVGPDGKTAGSHCGFFGYTVGQRHGLGGGSSEPRYVIRVVPEENKVVAGPRRSLAVSAVEIGAVNAFLPEAPRGALEVQLRYNSPAVPAEVEMAGAGTWKARLKQPVFGVAPGQSAVIYQGGAVAAGGIIVATESGGQGG